MDHIWSPWRMDYIMNHDRPAECVFCAAALAEEDQENLVIWRCRETFLILNRYPYTSGHVMVVPYAHVASLEALTPDTRAEMIEMANLAVQVLRAVYHPQGFNVGINIGEAAGAGIASHLHLHIVPRWAGDSNFMSAIADTRVLPESLKDSYERILHMWAQMNR